MAKSKATGKTKGLGQTEEVKDISLDEKKKILIQRAKLIEKPIDKTINVGEQIQVLEFILSNERYLINDTFISQVILLKELTPLPCTPEFILGIINVSGRILAVINIKKFLNLPETVITNLSRVILLKYQDIELGILVDKIIGSTHIYPDKLQTGITTLKGIQHDYLEGITEDRLMLLNIKKFLTSEIITVNDEV